MKLRDFHSPKDRRHALEKELGISLPHLSTYSFDQERASTRNCENMIGFTQVPLGVAGPLKIKDSPASQGEGLKIEEYYIPLVTTEGALVASVSRGCKVVTLSGGASVKIEKIGVTRAPVFFVRDMQHGEEVLSWIEKNFAIVKEKTEATSSHLTLLKIEPTYMGRNVFLKFYFDSQDAMGMNMASIAVSAVTPFIEEKTGAKLISASSNLCTDKKPSHENFIKGRGYKVWAEVIIPKNVIEEVLKTSVEALVETSTRKLFYGSALAGSLGYNAHVANVLAAIFLATGQDMAHISECAVGITTVEKHENGVYISVYLPDLMIGTVGGGTELETQKEALLILGVAGGNNGENAKKLAGIISAAVLAGEVSLLAALSNNTLACAHETLARGKR